MAKMIDLVAVLEEWPEETSPVWRKRISLLPRYIDLDLRKIIYAFAPVGLCNRVNRGDFDVDVPDTPPEPQPAPADPPHATPCCELRLSVTPEEWRGFMKGAVIACLDHNDFGAATDVLANLQAFNAANPAPATPEPAEPEKEAEPVVREPVGWVWRKTNGSAGDIVTTSTWTDPDPREQRYKAGEKDGWCPVYFGD